jgi:peptidoglycan/LPS O-acetylase OafA/YrhL
VCIHLGGVYWVERQLVADATFSPAQAVASPATLALFTTPWLNLGAFGVALFFLISGFVIPMSLERTHPIAFLVARVLRIFPTYWLCFALGVAAIALSAAYWHIPFTDGPALLLTNALLISDIANKPSVDLVNWTLMIELKFYVLMALLVVPLRRGSVIALAAIAIAILAISRFSHEIFLVLPGLGNALRIFEMNALYLLYMFIGVAFSFHARGSIGTRRLIGAVAGLFVAFVLCWPLTFFRGQFPLITLNYGYALVLFGALYAWRENVKASRILDYFAAISYPLYLVHALTGFALMQVLTALHVAPLPATLAAFVLALSLATVVHVAVEVPTQRLGKHLARRVARRGELLANPTPLG